MTERRKNAAAYMTNLCAVKNIQKEKRGTERAKQISPLHAASLGFLEKIIPMRITIKIIS